MIAGRTGLCGLYRAKKKNTSITLATKAAPRLGRTTVDGLVESLQASLFPDFPMELSQVSLSASLPLSPIKREL